MRDEQDADAATTALGAILDASVARAETRYGPLAALLRSMSVRRDGGHVVLRLELSSGELERALDLIEVAFFDDDEEGTAPAPEPAPEPEPDEIIHPHPDPRTIP